MLVRRIQGLRPAPKGRETTRGPRASRVALVFAFLAVLTAMPAWSREITLELDSKLYSFDPSRDLGRQNEVFGCG